MYHLECPCDYRSKSLDVAQFCGIISTVELNTILEIRERNEQIDVDAMPSEFNILEGRQYDLGLVNHSNFVVRIQIIRIDDEGMNWDDPFFDNSITYHIQPHEQMTGRLAPLSAGLYHMELILIGLQPEHTGQRVSASATIRSCDPRRGG